MHTPHHITVPRSARYFMLGAPDEARELWIACHGYGQLANAFLDDLGALSSDFRLVVAPEALSRFYLDDESGPHGPESRVGATWMTREDRETEIEDYVGYLERLYQQVAGELREAPARVVVLGFSQGVATAARWAARTAAPLDELVLWGGKLPPELEPETLLERFPRLLVTMVAGSRDRFVSETAFRGEESRLRARGLRVRALTFLGGHRLDDATLGAIAAGGWPDSAFAGR